MFLKWTGGLLILFAGSGMGVWLAWGYKKRLSTLETVSYTHLLLWKRKSKRSTLLLHY